MTKKKRKNKKVKKKIKDSVKKRFHITPNGKIFYIAQDGKKKQVKSKALVRKIKKLLGEK